MYRCLLHFEVPQVKGADAEKFLKERTTVMKGSPGFLGASVLRDTGEHEPGCNDYTIMHDWRSAPDWRAFLKKKNLKARDYFMSPTVDITAAPHEHEHHEHAAAPGNRLLTPEFHGHYDVVFVVKP